MQYEKYTKQFELLVEQESQEREYAARTYNRSSTSSRSNVYDSMDGHKPKPSRAQQSAPAEQFRVHSDLEEDLDDDMEDDLLSNDGYDMDQISSNLAWVIYLPST